MRKLFTKIGNKEIIEGTLEELETLDFRKFVSFEHVDVRESFTIYNMDTPLYENREEDDSLDSMFDVYGDEFVSGLKDSLIENSQVTVVNQYNKEIILSILVN